MILFNYLLIILLILIWWIFRNLKFLTPGVQFIQGVQHNENFSIVFIKPENLTKTELVEKFKELSSTKSLKELEVNKTEKKISFKILFKSYYSKLISSFLKIYGILVKLTLFSIILKILRKIKIVRLVWGLINSVLFSIFGIVFSDVYGFKEVFDYLKYYWIEYINFIHETRIYKVLEKILKSIKESDIKPSEVKPKSEVIESVIKKEVTETPSSFMTTNNPSSTGSEISITESEDNIRRTNKQEINNKYIFLVSLFLLAGLTWFLWENIITFLSSKPDSPDSDGNIWTNISPVVYREHSTLPYKTYNGPNGTFPCFVSKNFSL
jgi:hypothetical protein